MTTGNAFNFPDGNRRDDLRTEFGIGNPPPPHLRPDPTPEEWAAALAEMERRQQQSRMRYLGI